LATTGNSAPSKPATYFKAKINSMKLATEVTVNRLGS